MTPIAPLIETFLRDTLVAELEARLALDSVREQALVELSGLGELGLRLLEDESALQDDDSAGARPAAAAAPAPASPPAPTETSSSRSTTPGT